MDKQQATQFVQQAFQLAGTDRVRALFGKYNMRGVTPSVTAFVAGGNLYGQAFLTDFGNMVADAERAKAKADGDTGDYGMIGPPYEPVVPDDTGGGTNDGWTVVKKIMELADTAVHTTVYAWQAFTGAPTPSTTSTTATQPNYYILPGNSAATTAAAAAGNSNTTLIIVIVSVVLVVLIALIAVTMLGKKK
ncbi:MAG: hypothetical protein LBF90_03240 [Prevotellaceae bacterium]|jgi:hypothetical protein|nr:hypothetical protein [Prevotellaceae bacterium]